MADDLTGNIDAPPESQKSGMSLTSLSLNNISVKEIVRKSREGVRPWGDFINTRKFKLPKGLAQAGSRVVKNVEHFQSNYLFVFLGLVIFCVVTSPLLLVAVAACLGACYVIRVKNAEKKMIVMGRELTVSQQYAAVGVASFPLFWLAGAGSVVFWIIGASIFAISLHAAMFDSSEEADEENLLEMDEVLVTK